jgi:HSP90 family molecular chaperone
MDGLKDVPVLLLTDDIDDFVVNSVGPFSGKTFVSVDSGEVEKKPATNDSELNSFSDEEKSKITQLFKASLGEKKFAEIVYSSNLVSSPAVVTSQLSPHMRKMMKNIIAQTASSAPSNEDIFDAMPVKLELSQSHDLIRSLLDIADDSDETIKKIIPAQIYYNAMLSAGMIDDARAVLPTITELVQVCIKQAVAARATTQ